MSGPSLSDIDFKNKMACVWTTLNTQNQLPVRSVPDRSEEGLNWFPLHDALFDFEYSTAKGRWPPTSVIFDYFLEILWFSIFKLSISI